MQKNEIKHKFYLGQLVRIEGEKEFKRIIGIKVPTIADNRGYSIADDAGIVSYRLTGSNTYQQEHTLHAT